MAWSQIHLEESSTIQQHDVDRLWRNVNGENQLDIDRDIIVLSPCGVRPGQRCDQNGSETDDGKSSDHARYPKHGACLPKTASGTMMSVQLWTKCGGGD